MNNDIGLKIKRLRKLKGITQKELAEKIGVTRLTINKYEKSYFAPSHKYINLICKELDCTEEYLCGVEEENINKYFINDKIFEYLIENAIKIRYEDINDEDLKFFKSHVTTHFKMLDSVYNEINDEYFKEELSEGDKIEMEIERKKEEERNRIAIEEFDKMYPPIVNSEEIIITEIDKIEEVLDRIAIEELEEMYPPIEINDEYFEEELSEQDKIEIEALDRIAIEEFNKMYPPIVKSEEIIITEIDKK
jgi:transcriptional regulator with XRE-family HTH domain